MPLNKLDNFIKNTEGRILYVSPADLDSTDSIDNTGNSLARPFKTIQRALLESARFSYVKGTSNDLTERTTILLMPGDHLVDNRPGFKLYKNTAGNTALVVPPGYSHTGSAPPTGTETASAELNLDLDTSFDLTKEDNILYKFNSVHGGVIVPRGTSIVGLDLRKTKIKPLYVPNPTASYENTPASAIFRITGACYFWQFSFFDGDENGLVYTDPSDFSSNNKSKPLFSHHKLTCFEYADGVNNVPIGAFDTELTDLDMYYAKLSNAYGTASGSPDRDIDDKYPTKPDGFAKQRPEWEIVGAFATDPISIASITAGDGNVASNTVTVNTAVDHNLTEGTPIKIRGVGVSDYNISTKVATVSTDNPRQFTYQLPRFRENLPVGTARVDASSAEVVIETDTVTGASPYIFNISLRSVYGMNGMQADGAKADGFRSMVVAQFTGVSLQKDDRAFVKYDKTSRSYNSIVINKVTGSELSSGSSSINTEKVYHLDSEAIYRNGWEQTHIRIKNDSILQIVSVFAIGYNKHFNCESGADASITNSNSNFGQLSLVSDGFKKNAFAKDNKAFITNIFTPRSIETEEEDIDWLNIDVDTTLKANAALTGTPNDRLYLAGFVSEDSIPPILTQGYRVGAKVNDRLYAKINDVEEFADIRFIDQNNSEYTSFRALAVDNVSDTKLDFGQLPRLAKGEKVLLISDSGDYPENIVPHQIYYAITFDSTGSNANKIELASTKTDAENGNAIQIYGGSDLKIISRVTDKVPGEAGHPIQWDGDTLIDRDDDANTPDEPVNRWYIKTTSNSGLYTAIDNAGIAAFENGETEPTYIKRRPDPRSLDEKIYKFRVVVPKELQNGKTPEAGFILQESSLTNLRNNEDFRATNVADGFEQNNATQKQKITLNDYEFEKNPRFISTCTFNSSTSIVTIETELPHNMRVGEKVIIEDVTDVYNPLGEDNKGYNGTFEISTVEPNNMGFTVVNNNVPQPASVSNNSTARNIDLPRFKRNDVLSNFYIYRNETIAEYIENQQDGVYHIYTLRSDVGITTEFTNLKYSQNVTDLYPQLDRDNLDDSPKSARSYALSSPIGDVHTSDLKNSITRDTAHVMISRFTKDLIVDSAVVSASSGIGHTDITFTRNHSFNGAVSGSVGGSQVTAPSNYYDQTIYNVKLYNGSSTGTTWNGATVKIEFDSAGNYNTNSVSIMSRGSGYTNGQVLYIDESDFGGNNTLQATYTLDTTNGIVDASNDYIQITGNSQYDDQYYMISAIPAANRITVLHPSASTQVVPGQLAIHIGRKVAVSSYDDINGTVTCSQPHGLVKGNRFRFVDSSGNSLGDFIVNTAPNTTPTVFTIDITDGGPSGTVDNTSFVLKHYMSANDAVSDASQESIAARGNTFYGGDCIKLSADLLPLNTDPALRINGQDLPQTLLSVTNLDAANQDGIEERFPMGTYIQIDDELMRVANNNLINGKMVVIRGVLATEIQEHASGSLIKKINPVPIEFRRPSIIRASGHTFEYLGYGPGNYSTGLPQVQDRTLTEREEFLTQAQERSAGIVVYTGMNNKGDFYIGNTKKSSATGEETSFDTPIPTVAGENAARLSAIFDEVTVKERIVVEGGDSGLILSQFDGPVTFNKEIRVKNNLTIGDTNSGVLKVKNTTDSTSVTTGSVQIAGGVGIGKTVNIGGNIYLPDEKKLIFGNDTSSPDDKNHQFEIYSSPSNGTGGYGANIIGCASTDRALRVQTDAVFVVEGTDGQNLIRALNPKWTRTPSLGGGNGSVELYYINDTGDANNNDGLRLYTTTGGVYINGELQVSDDITAFYSSDERLKDNILPIEDPLTKLMKIGGYTYNWNEKSGKKGPDVGVIAQEVDMVGLPGITTTRDNGYMAVNYEKLVPLLVQSVRELNGKVDRMKEKIKSLEQQLSDK